jgi:penicillin-insensitive murein endopeptidase
MYGRDYHFHIRIECPAADGECDSQSSPLAGEGWSAKDIAYWFSEPVLQPRPSRHAAKAADDAR